MDEKRIREAFLREVACLLKKSEGPRLKELSDTVRTLEAIEQTRLARIRSRQLNVIAIVLGVVGVTALSVLYFFN